MMFVLVPVESSARMFQDPVLKETLTPQLVLQHMQRSYSGWGRKFPTPTADRVVTPLTFEQVMEAFTARTKLRICYVSHYSYYEMGEKDDEPFIRENGSREILLALSENLNTEDFYVHSIKVPHWDTDSWEADLIYTWYSEKEYSSSSGAVTMTFICKDGKVTWVSKSTTP